jgi:hypothetical protein
MNRSILIVICDFLLVSLLAFSTVDLNKPAQEGVPRGLKLNNPTNQVDSRQDLAAVMRLALEQEHLQRESLAGELTRTRETVGQQQALLGERDKQVSDFRQELQKKDQQTSQLQQQQKGLQQDLQLKQQQAAQLEQQQKGLQQELQLKQQQTAQLEQQQQSLRQELRQKDQQATQLEQQRASLSQQFTAAQTNLFNLNQQLQASSADAASSRDKLAALQAELRKQSDQAAAFQQQLGLLAQSNQSILTEKQRLAGQLQIAETEKRLAREQVAHMQEEVKVERAEKARLAEGVTALATKSDQLTREIQQNRPLASNTIFNQFVSNRVQATFWGVRPGFLGLGANKGTSTLSVLASDGTNTVALCHVQDTPLSFSYPGTEWEGLTGQLERHDARIPIQSLSFSQLDPRLVFMPFTPAEARQLGSLVYHTSSEPYKFQDAVVVGAQAGYYGECAFQIDLTTPLYLKMDHNSLKGLFGKFNPARGDLVFSRTGELLGVMANNTYCIMLKNFNASATVKFGQNVRDQQTGQTLSRFYSQITSLPSRLQ